MNNIIFSFLLIMVSALSLLFIGVWFLDLAKYFKSMEDDFNE
ncbi:hypothetical protein [Alkaliphilus oremlandii]|nr:hypothetical protein [Alkaliphilus oremlandii]